MQEIGPLQNECSVEKYNATNMYVMYVEAYLRTVLNHSVLYQTFKDQLTHGMNMNDQFSILMAVCNNMFKFGEQVQNALSQKDLVTLYTCNNEITEYICLSVEISELLTLS